MGTHSPSPTGSHTTAHTAKHGRFGWGWYLYPRSVSHVSETLRGQVSERQTLPLLGLGRGYSRRTQRACGTAMRSCALLFRRRRGPAGLRDLFRFCRSCGLYTLGSPRKIAHKGTHAETGGVLGGGAIITLDTSCTFTNIPGPGVRTANFAAFGSWSGGALEERREPAEQRCAYAHRCSKASRPRWAA